MITDLIYNYLCKKRDKKLREIIRLRWQKAKLEKQLAQLKKDSRQRDSV